MRRNLRKAYQDFSASIVPVKKLMTFIRNTTNLRDHELTRQHYTIQCGSYVIMSGFLESYLKAISEAYFGELHSMGIHFYSLPESYRKRHIEYGVKVLDELIKYDRKKGSGFIDTEAFIRRLAAPFASPASVPVWEAFSRTNGNPGPDVIADFLRAHEVTDPLRTLSAMTGGRYTEPTIKTLLLNFITVRNECAHTGEATNIPQPSSIEATVEFLRHLALGIAKALDKQLSTLRASIVIVVPENPPLVQP